MRWGDLTNRFFFFFFAFFVFCLLKLNLTWDFSTGESVAMAEGLPVAKLDGRERACSRLGYVDINFKLSRVW